MLFANTLYLKIISFTFLLALLTISCEEEQIVTVDAKLQPYFDLFEEEGNARGIDVDLAAAEISGMFTSIEQENVTGQCAINSSTGVKIIRVDQSFWTTASNLEKEFLIFHELGHCYLDRRHLDETDARGNCNSMMYSGENICKMNYSNTTRSAYLDELFYPY